MRVALCIVSASLFLAACGGGEPEPAASSTPEPAPAAAPAATAVPSIAEQEAAVPGNPLKDAYFGNLHVHSGWSFDATTNGSITTPDSAYRWAKGEAISGGEGLPDLQILRPLDWMAVSEHAEYLGVLPLMANQDSPLSQHPLAVDIFGGDPDASFAAYQEISDQIYGVPPSPDPELYSEDLRRTLWSEVVEITDSHY